MDTGADRPVIQRYFGGYDAATYLGISYAALRKLVERAEIPVSYRGRRYVFDRFDLDAHMRQHRIEAWAS